MNQQLRSLPKSISADKTIMARYQIKIQRIISPNGKVIAEATSVAEAYGNGETKTNQNVSVNISFSSSSSSCSKSTSSSYSKSS